MGNVFPAELAEFAPFQPIRIVLLILHSGIVSLLADRAGQINDLSHLLTRQASGVKRKAMADILPSSPYSLPLTPHAPLMI
jgi:hypothetical protein